MSRTWDRSSGASDTVPWCERMLQGVRNSGRAVANTNNGTSAPRSAKARRTSRVVGSAHWRSSNTNTAGCTLAPAITQLVSAANCRRRNSSAASAGARPGGSGISRSAASSGALSAGRRRSPAASTPAVAVGGCAAFGVGPGGGAGFDRAGAVTAATASSSAVARKIFRRSPRTTPMSFRS